MEALPPVTETSDQLLLLSLYFGQFIRTLSEIRHSIATTYVYTNIHIIMHWIQIPWNWPSPRKIPEICQQPSVSHQARFLEQGLALNLFWLELSCFSSNWLINEWEWVDLIIYEWWNVYDSDLPVPASPSPPFFSPKDSATCSTYGENDQLDQKFFVLVGRNAQPQIVPILESLNKAGSKIALWRCSLHVIVFVFFFCFCSVCVCVRVHVCVFLF